MRGVSDLAVGRWPGLLVHFGVDAASLTGKHGPCPACGGKDRFRFDDKDGRGTFFCSHCGAGDGFSLLGLVKGWPFGEAAREVEAVVGTISPAQRPAPVDVDQRESCRRVWGESLRVTADDPVGRYLRRRCGDVQVPSCIRFHPALAYRHDDGRITKHPAMVCRVQDANGQGVALHRTYLTASGDKAALTPAKKILGKLPQSSAIRLFPSDIDGYSRGLGNGSERVCAVRCADVGGGVGWRSRKMGSAFWCRARPYFRRQRPKWRRSGGGVVPGEAADGVRAGGRCANPRSAGRLER